MSRYLKNTGFFWGQIRRRPRSRGSFLAVFKNKANASFLLTGKYFLLVIAAP
jgi:hypothetical protein